MFLALLKEAVAEAEMGNLEDGILLLLLLRRLIPFFASANINPSKKKILNK